MPRISIETVRPGQILAEDVQGTGGVILIRQGTVLTPSALCSLQTRGIRQVCVDQDPGDPAGEPDSTRRQLIEKRFAAVRGDEIMEIVRAAVLEFQTGNPVPHE